MSGEKVLILGDDTRSFLAIVRSLGRRGITVHAAPSNFRSPSLRSRYIARVHDLPPWIGDGRHWLTATEGLLRAERYNLVIPCNERTLLPLQRCRAILSQVARLAIPEDREIAVLFDKHETRELAKRVGVTVAAGRLTGPNESAEDVIAEYGTPVVVKPRFSYSLETLAARSKVHILDEPVQLQRYLSQCAPAETLLEKYFAGQGVGISVLVNKGRLLQAFEHRRVREVHGASFYRYSAPPTEALLRACELITSELRYTGIAMFEFKRNPAWEWVLLEINARPWGSMPLPLALGVDFPYRWYRLLVAGEEAPAIDYRTGVYARNLVPDLQNSMAEAEKLQLSRVATAWFMILRVAELSRWLTGKEIHDVLVRDDPRPGLTELFEIVNSVWRRIVSLLPGDRSRRRHRARREVEALHIQRSAQPRILFICQGNICRSPFAEALLRERLRGLSIEVASAGVMPQSGRPTPALGIAAAAEHAIDLSRHGSVWLSRQLAEAASLLVVFDRTTREAVRDLYPDLSVPIIMLGDLVGLAEVRDPVDGDLAEFRDAYNKIATGASELAAILRDDIR